MENASLEIFENNKYNKYLKMLELDKIINLVISYTTLDKSKEELANIKLMNDVKEIETNLNEVNEASVLISKIGMFPLYFSNDLNLCLSKIHKNGMINPLELAQIGNFLDSIRDLILYFNNLEDNKIESIFLNKHLNNIVYPKDLNLKIKKIVTPYGEIKEDASAELKNIYKNISEMEKNIQNKIQELLFKNASKLSLNTISMKNDRYVLAVKNEYKNQIKGIIHDESSSGETVYIEPLQVVEMTNKIATLKEEEKREIDRILKNISQSIDAYYSELSYDYIELINLDIIFAKAKYAIKIDGRMPKINKDGIVEIYNCFHPLLNVSNIVKNNIIIGKEYKGIIITGPNTGGKTVLLKTLGLLALMVKCGLLIPASDNSNINIFDNVFSDIGDEQSINQNLSTFSSHMKNVIEIIDNVSANSLVLLDELGSGTDPMEGASLAIAIFDHLISLNCLLVATSHYSELKLHAYNSKNIINASVEFDSNTLKPTYRLLIGVPGMSNAINVAKNLGLKEEILNSALDYVYKKDDNINVILNKLVNQSNLLDKKIREIEYDKEILNTKILEKENEIKKVIEEKNKIIKNANNEKQKLIDESMAEINEILANLKDIKNKNVKEHEIANIKHRIRTLNENNLNEEVYDKKLPITEGAFVYIKSYKAYGNVIKILKDKCEVNMGSLSLVIDNDDLVVSEKANIENSNTYKSNNVKANNNKITIKKNVSMKLDLRGMRYEEASDAIDKYLDDCIYASFSTCTIIHGFGTGTIRKLVQEKLKNNKNVLEYRYGGEKEGGFGATVVTFKNDKN